MRQQTSPAIVLRRTNYGEADRVVTFLTPVGKVAALVKGVRRSKSKLAGGIELFSESSITFMETRGNLARIISSRLITHWDEFLGDLQRMMFGYEAMKLIDKAIEEEAERGYYDTLKEVLEGLSDLDLPLSAIETWFDLRLLALLGRMPNLKTDSSGKNLENNTRYSFSPDEMCFNPNSSGPYRPEQITFLRLCQTQKLKVIKHVKDIEETAKPLATLLKQLLTIQV